jgi:phage tail-like protein
MTAESNGIKVIEGYANCRFYVEINGITRAVFTELGPIQIETMTEEYAEGGNNFFVYRLPGHTRVGNVILKRGLTKTMELFNWYMQIVQGKMDRRHMSVSVYDTQGATIARWDFINAFPVRWVGPQLQSDGGLIAIETLELAHEGLILSNN